MQADVVPLADPLVVRAAILAILKEGQGHRMRASELQRLAAPTMTDFPAFLAIVEQMDEEDLIDVAWNADAEGVPQDPDPECWID
jgi:hypothetical protein